MTDPKHFLSIRLSASERKAIQQLYKSSGCRNLTEYAKKKLMNNTVPRVPEHVLSFIIEKLIRIEERLDQKMDEALLKEVTDIRTATTQFLENSLSIH